MSKKKDKVEPSVIGANGKPITLELMEHNLRERAVMLHGKQAGMLAALGVANALVEAGASPQTLAISLDTLHDDWQMRAAHALGELENMVGEEAANLPCMDCGGPVADCHHAHTHEHDHDDEPGDDDE